MVYPWLHKKTDRSGCRPPSQYQFAPGTAAATATESTDKTAEHYSQTRSFTGGKCPECRG